MVGAGDTVTDRMGLVPALIERLHLVVTKNNKKVKFLFVNIFKLKKKVLVTKGTKTYIVKCSFIYLRNYILLSIFNLSISSKLQNKSWQKV